MSTAPQVPDQLAAIVQQATVDMVPLFAAAANPASAVRIGWQPLGQPFNDSDADVAYVRCYTVDDAYDRWPDLYYETDGDVYTEYKEYTRAWEVYWSVFGPNGFDNARQIRSRLIDQDIHDLFAAANLYLVNDRSELTYVPYEMDGKWWKRTDFKAHFYEAVTETTTQDGYVTSVEINIQDSFGNLITDFTVTEE